MRILPCLSVLLSFAAVGSNADAQRAGGGCPGGGAAASTGTASAATTGTLTTSALNGGLSSSIAAQLELQRLQLALEQQRMQQAYLAQMCAQEQKYVADQQAAKDRKLQARRERYTAERAELAAAREDRRSRATAARMLADRK